MAEKTIFTVRREQCAKCYFYDMIAKMDSGESIYICRKYGPHSAAALIAMPGKGGAPIPQWMYTTHWNRVMPTDWCGEFKEKEAANS